MSYISHTEVFSLRFPAIYKNQNCLWLPYRRYLLVLLVVTQHNDSIMGKSSRFRKLALAFIFAQGKKIHLIWVAIFICDNHSLWIQPKVLIGCSCARTKTKTKVFVRSGQSLWRTNQASVLWYIEGSVCSSCISSRTNQSFGFRLSFRFCLDTWTGY